MSNPMAAEAIAESDYSEYSSQLYVVTKKSTQEQAKTSTSSEPPSICEHSKSYYAMKRCIDILGSIGIALVFAPILLVVPFLVKRDGGPVMFKQTRIGKDGKTFGIYKFRSMVTNADERLEELLKTNPAAAEEWERDHKLKDDPRITRVGKFLRKTSLDEIPQLINVLKGEMSLVGPRPIVDKEIPKYGKSFKYYASVKPGLTGIWQVSGRNDVDYNQRVALDRLYSTQPSIAMDVAIIAKTPIQMLISKTGY